MSINIKNAAAATGLAVAAAFSTGASAQEAGMELDSTSYDAITECIAQNPEGPKECIRATMTDVISQQIRDLQDDVRNGNILVPQSHLDTLVCTMRGVPDIVADHYEIGIKASDKGTMSILGGNQHDFDALKDFMAAAIGMSNDCIAKHMPTRAVQDVDAMLDQMDQMREMILAPQ